MQRISDLRIESLKERESKWKEDTETAKDEPTPGRKAQALHGLAATHHCRSCMSTASISAAISSALSSWSSPLSSPAGVPKAADLLEAQVLELFVHAHVCM